MLNFVNRVRNWFTKSANTQNVVCVKEDDVPGSLIEQNAMNRNKRFLQIQHGAVFCQNGKLFVSNPGEFGAWATLDIPKDSRIRVFVDGEVKHGRVFVMENKEIQVEFDNKPASVQLLVKPSTDAMAVSARVEIVLGEEYFLKNFRATRNAPLEIGVKKVYPTLPSVNELKVLIDKLGYQGKFDEDALIELSQAKATMERTVLRGRAPVEASPKFYEKVVLPLSKDLLYSQMGSSSITKGTVFAYVHSAVPGIPGKDVFGKLVPLKPTDSLPVLGSGVIEIGNTLIAIQNGRLHFSDSLIDVVPELVIHHDLSPKDGIVDFSGHVVIYGSVLDGCIVKATGKIEIYGNVFRSIVMGERGITISGLVMGSRLVAGQTHIVYGELLSILKRCLLLLADFEYEYSELVKQAKYRFSENVRSAAVATVLLTKRYQRLHDLINGFYKNAGFLELVDERYRCILHELESKWRGIHFSSLTDSDILHLYNLFEEYVKYLESIQSSDMANITLHSVTSSFVQSSGNIMVLGDGAFTSTIQSNRSVSILNVMRGGSVTASQSVVIHELGTSTGVLSSVKVLDERGKASIRIRHPNTRLLVGRKQITMR